MSTFKPNEILKNTHLQTRLVHTQAIGPEGFKSLSTPVYRGSSLFFENTAAQRAAINPLGLDYSYGVHGNPTQFTLAKKLAMLEGCQHGLIVPSGLSAIATTVLGLLKTGDHWLLPDNVYGPAQLLAKDLACSAGISFSTYNPMDLQTLANQLTPETRLVWVEAPGSLTFETPDLAELKKIVKQDFFDLVAQRKHSGNLSSDKKSADNPLSQAAVRTPLLAIDNTYAAGIAFKPFEFGFDVSVQALTKYQCGHADVLMGAVLADNTEVFAAIERKNRVLGLCVSPEDCALVLRGLLTLPLRYHHQAENALQIAKWLQAQPEVLCVLHPLMPDAPGHQAFVNHFSAAASVFSVVFKPEFTDNHAAAFVDELKLFHIAYSWGGPESLATVVQLPPARFNGLRQQYRRNAGPTVRLCIGLEAPEDLITDLQESLGKMHRQCT
ncbi:MAG: cystathionine beta-lyase [Limnobacter sp.]|nr:cystathionine beta-lyase [Limnobacter sp.]